MDTKVVYGLVTITALLATAMRLTRKDVMKLKRDKNQKKTRINQIKMKQHLMNQKNQIKKLMN